MKLRAVRVRETGCFSAPVAIEGLDAGLNVLTGPNESGKSTIFRALRALFLEKHSSIGEKRGLLVGLRPATGGAPLVEVDFETGSGVWRLRKQFLNSKSATLSDLASRRVVARGEEADTRALELVAGSSRAEAGFGLLWVEQKGSLSPPNLEGPAETVLQQIIEREVLTVAGGGMARAVRLAAEALLKPLTGGRSGGPQAGSDYLKAKEACYELAARLSQAQSSATTAQERLDRLAELRARELAIVNPDQAALRTKRFETAERALEAARSAREKFQTAIEAATAREKEFELAAAEQKSLEVRLADVRNLDTKATQVEAKLIGLKRQDAEAASAALEARRRREELSSDLVLAQSELKAIEASERRRAVQQKHWELQTRISAAQTTQNDIDALNATLVGLRVTEPMMRAMRREENDIRALQAQVSASAPRITVAYEKGVEGIITAGGIALQDGATLLADQVLRLHIEGVGVITVEPGAAAGLDDVRADLDAHRLQLADLLREAAVPSITSAEAGLEQRRKCEAQLTASRARFDALAPGGMAPLQSEIAQLIDPDQGSSEGDLVARPLVEQKITRLTADKERLAIETGKIDGTILRLAAEVASATADLQSLRNQIETLQSQLPPAAQRFEVLQNLNATVAKAERAFDAARRDVKYWTELTGGLEGIQPLEREYQTALAVIDDAESELSALRENMRHLEGALERDRHEGVGAQVEELSEQLAVAQVSLEQFETDKAALNLLLETLAEAEVSSRQRYLQPVADRLTPYLQIVFPEAKVNFANGFTVSAIERSGTMEDTARLSDGTREQLAVLVRLGFARLLADTGEPVPLILDDALVYSDDARLTLMFSALRRAAEHHQVLVLTCHAHSFAGLGGKNLNIESWRPD